APHRGRCLRGQQAHRDCKQLSNRNDRSTETRCGSHLSSFACGFQSRLEHTIVRHLGSFSTRNRKVDDSAPTHPIRAIMGREHRPERRKRCRDIVQQIEDPLRSFQKVVVVARCQ
ncbi:unnamed protein product, partial [Mycena citricolor]